MVTNYRATLGAGKNLGVLRLPIESEIRVLGAVGNLLAPHMSPVLFRTPREAMQVHPASYTGRQQ